MTASLETVGRPDLEPGIKYSDVILGDGRVQKHSSLRITVKQLGSPPEKTFIGYVGALSIDIGKANQRIVALQGTRMISTTLFLHVREPRSPRQSCPSRPSPKGAYLRELASLAE